MLKFTCEKSLLVSAISVASRTVAAKSPISVLEGIYLQAGMNLQLTGYNLETGITVGVPAEVQEIGECVMPARLFFDIVRRLPDEAVTVCVDEKYRVSIRCGISSFSFSAENAMEYPELPSSETEEDSICIPQHELREMISGTIFSASEQSTRPILTGVLFEADENSMTAIAIDTFRLARRCWRPEKPIPVTGKFVVPAPALREVEKILADTDDPAVITKNKRHITFRIGDAKLVCRMLEGEFMDWRKVLRTGETTKIVGSVARLSESLERVGLMVTEKFKSPVVCTFSNQSADFRTETTMGSAHDSCTIAGDGKDLKIGFNCRYLLDALHAVPSEEVTLELTNSLSPIVMTPTDGTDGFTYLILPVRIKAD